MLQKISLDGKVLNDKEIEKLVTNSHRDILH